MKTELNRIKIVLCEKKRTGKWLSEIMNANPTTISKWCTNTSQPDLYTLNKIAKALNVNIRELIVDK